MYVSDVRVCVRARMCERMHARVRARVYVRDCVHMCTLTRTYARARARARTRARMRSQMRARTHVCIKCKFTYMDTVMRERARDTCYSHGEEVAAEVRNIGANGGWPCWANGGDLTLACHPRVTSKSAIQE
jgi:hypothetical protein